MIRYTENIHFFQTKMRPPCKFIQFFPIHESTGKIKGPAGNESGSGIYIKNGTGVLIFMMGEEGTGKIRLRFLI